MKKLSFLFLALIAVLIVGCSQSSKTSSDARTSMEALLKELARNPESVKIENVNTVYGNDSLSILHFDFTAKNGLGMENTSKMEYIYLVQGDKKYEAVHELGSDNVFVDTQALEKLKKGSIFQDLDYDSALRYLAATYINGNGRVVGDKSKEQEVNISVPTGTGSWELKSYSDSFGDETDDRYLTLLGNGVFSNSATLNSDLKALLFVDGNSFSFRLIEYGFSPVKDDDAPYNTQIKDSEGKVHNFTLWNSGQSGQIGPLSQSQNDYKEFVDILNKGGEITVIMNYNRYSETDYRFKMNVDGFNKAIKFVK